MSLQANQYLVYLGRDDEQQVTRDDDHRPPRPPPIQYASSSLTRSDHTSLPQHVPNPTPIAQSTPRSVSQLPSSTTTMASVDTQRSRQSQYQAVNNTPSRSYHYITSIEKVHISSVIRNIIILGSSQLIPPPRPSSSSRPVLSNRSEETPSFVSYPLTPSTGISHLNLKVPPRIPPRISRTPKPSSPIEQEVPLSTETKIRTRRPPPPPPLPAPPASIISKPRSSRKYSRSNSNVDVQQRALSAIGSRTLSTAKHAPLREEQLLKRSSSADRVGRERWLHHITDSSAINNGFPCLQIILILILNIF
jgi:hypothetical protein